VRSLVVSTSSPYQFGVDRSVDFRVCLLVSNWVGSYQGAVLPESVFFLSLRVCVDSEAWECGRVGYMHVTELDFLCAFGI